MKENSLERQIIQHMKDHHLGKWVSPATVIGIINDPGTFKALNNLIDGGIIEKKYVNKLPFIRYSEPFRHLKVIK